MQRVVTCFGSLQDLQGNAVQPVERLQAVAVGCPTPERVCLVERLAHGVASEVELLWGDEKLR